MKLPAMMSELSFEKLVTRAAVDDLPTVANQGLFIRKLCKLLPIVNEDEVDTHIKWYVAIKVMSCALNYDVINYLVQWLLGFFSIVIYNK
jgi:hypothetical protein